MSEDRTMPPSKRRRQLAREHGQVAHSPELTAAVGWMVAVLALGFWGGGLAQETVNLARHSVMEVQTLRADPATVVTHVQGQVMALLAPLGILLAGFCAGAIAAHQLQVGGLWAPALLAPDPTRLWTLGRNVGLGAGIEKIAWAIIKVAVLAAVSLWLARSEWTALQRLGELDFPALAPEIGRVVLHPARVIGVVMLVLGLADYGLRYYRFESSLQTTREEQREDQRMMEGDTATRSRRMRLARAWRGDAPELLAGASLVVTGAGGLAVVLAGGPPPRRLTVRSVAQGNTGLRLRGSSHAGKVAQVEAPELARQLAIHASTNSLQVASVPPLLMSELAAVWPAKEGTVRPKAEDSSP